MYGRWKIPERGRPVRLPGAAMLIAAVALACGGCAQDNSALTTKIAALERTTQDQEARIDGLENQARKLKAELVDARDASACMRILFELPAEWKRRLRTDLLDFSSESDLNAGVMAEADIADGHLNILEGGLSTIWGKRAKVLREKYNIWVMHVAGEDDGKTVFKLINSYNTVSKAAIRAKYGQSFLDNVFKPSGTATDPATGTAKGTPAGTTASMYW